jgi:hypothetical protein
LRGPTLRFSYPGAPGALRSAAISVFASAWGAQNMRADHIIIGLFARLPN